MLTGSHVFVCAHGSRDMRCGVCGPALIEKFNNEIEVRGLKDQTILQRERSYNVFEGAHRMFVYKYLDNGSSNWTCRKPNNQVHKSLRQNVICINFYLDLSIVIAVGASPQY